MRFDRFAVLTFDCYGTLIDWEAGILHALRSVLGPRGVAPENNELLSAFAAAESPIQQGPFRSYRTVLNLTMSAIGRHFGFQPTADECAMLSASVPQWPAFPDTIAALHQLAGRYRLGILSNVDDDLFAPTAARLGVTFDWVVTAQQVGSYKPGRTHFHRALSQIGLPWDQVLHCAQSLYHDVVPARSMGLATVWVDRRGPRHGGGATPPAAVQPSLTVPDLATLARLALE